MPERPKISVITPSYNQGKYIETTIQSILNQNYSNLEYIIIDGGSTDNSVNIIKKYEENLTYWISEKDKGQSHAINKGLNRITGDIVTWINSDDQLLPHTLNKVVSYFEKHKEVSFIHGKTILFKENSNYEVIKGSNAGFIPFAYLSGMCFSQPSSFFKTSLIKKLGVVNEKLHFGMDYDLFVRFALNNSFLMVDDVFSKYLLHKNSKTMISNKNFADEWAMIFSKVLRSFDFTNTIIEDMKSLNLYQKKDDYYSVSKQFDIEYLKKSFYCFLYFQIYFRYENLEINQVHQITTFIKKHNADFLVQEQLDKIHFRTSLPFSKNIISLSRKIFR